MTTQRRTKADTEHGRRSHGQVSSNRDRGERCKRDGQEESDDARKGWSGGSKEDLEVSETEEEGMIVRSPEGRM